MRYILVIVLLLFGIADNVFSAIIAASAQPEKIIDTDIKEAKAVQEAEASCPESCDDNDACTADSCESGACTNKIIACHSSNVTCPDGFVAVCENTCAAGKCSECLPLCTGYSAQATSMPIPVSTPTPCMPRWQCTTSMCINDQQTRTCTDDNGCTASTTEMQSCVSVNHVIFSEVFYDTPGNESNEEWLKLYNPTDSGIAVINWSITDNAGTWKFTSTISPKSYLIIARSGSGFKNLTGCNADLSGFTRGLNNDGDYLILKDNTGTEIDFVAWEKGYNNSYPQWNITAQQGKSIKRISLASDTDSVADWMVGEPQPCT